MPCPPRSVRCRPRSRSIRAVLALALIALCLGPGTGQADTRVDRALAPFENAQAMPPLIAALPFAADRAYAVLVMIPAPAPVSLADPDTVQRGVLAFLNPIATYRAGTRLGHAMVGWRCADGTLGLTGKTSDDPDLGLRMLRDGWGMAAMLSEYRYGRLVALADLAPEHQRALRGDRTRVAAFEIDERACQSMRRALAAYLAHPGQPEIRYTNLPDPARMTGDGCASFALWLAGRGGVFDTLAPRFQRRIVLRASFLGHADIVPEGIVPFRTGDPGTPVGLRTLLLGDWQAGRVVGALSILDPELMLAALDRALARAGIDREPRLAVRPRRGAGARRR